MRTGRKKCRGFSLTELLFALGVLSIGMVFVAGVFPAGVMFTMQSSERTIATVVAEEAFAKVRLYRIDSLNPQLVVDQQVNFNDITVIPPYEFEYPTSFDVDPVDKNYYWSALCRPLTLDPNIPNSPVQVTVFVCRRIGAGGISAPFRIGVNVPGDPNEILLNNGEQNLVSDGSILVDDLSGRIYRVQTRYRDNELLIRLTEPWQGLPSGNVWVVPPVANGSRNPCIAVHQRVIRFTN